MNRKQRQQQRATAAAAAALLSPLLLLSVALQAGTVAAVYPSAAEARHSHARAVRQAVPAPFAIADDKPSCENTGAASGQLQFESYHSSPWEQLWAENAAAWSKTVCGHMIDQQELSWEWLNGTHKFSTPGTSQYGRMDQVNTTIFSKFVYADPCNRTNRAEVFIEPLVGLMRHPFTPKDACNPPNVKAARTQAREYLMLNAMEPSTFKSLYPGRAYLFDLGTNYFNTSLSWVLRKWAAFGVEFDAVYAWEAEPLDHDLYWSQVPKNVYPYLHMFNIPISNNFNNPGHPFTILKQIYRPGDYVVIKLDIDFATLEAAIMKEVHDDPQLRSMIAEMFFELHFDTPETRLMFKNGEATTPYTEAIKLFHDLRKLGLRLHPWP